MSKKKILGLDLGSNSIGWALLEAEAGGDGRPTGLIDLGVRIFPKAVEDKTPTPKNIKRRQARLARRVTQRRARRRKRMLNYLIKLGLLPESLRSEEQPEKILNGLGDPYKLRAKALNVGLESHQLGRVLLHMVQRRGFLSNKKTLLGVDMSDDPDVIAVLEEMREDDPDNESENTDAEEQEFKQGIAKLRAKITAKGFRTLGEYLASLDEHECKRNRKHEGGYLRTDRQMYRDELDEIWKQQAKHHSFLTDKVKDNIKEILFHQRPLKLDPDRVGRCSLEKHSMRSRTSRLEAQQFRYLCDINNLDYFEPNSEQEIQLNQKDRERLWEFFESTPKPTFAKIRKCLGLDRRIKFNLEHSTKKLYGNTTACSIREVLPDWDVYPEDKKHALAEDLITIQKKSALKKRLINHWNLDGHTAVKLCMLELEPGHANLSSRAINRMLPFLRDGKIYSEARELAGYGYEQKAGGDKDRLDMPPEIPNPIVQKGLHELRRVVNAIVAEYGKPDTIRIEMARDLEMNTKRYKENERQQMENKKANEEAEEKYQEIARGDPGLGMRKWPTRDDKIKYRLWKEQENRCAYSNRSISLAELFSAQVEIDHILPISRSLQDSYMNKTVCFAAENRAKGNRTPRDAFGEDEKKWGQIAQSIDAWYARKLKSKKDRFYKTSADLEDLEGRDFAQSQLNDTRYICREAHSYLKKLVSDISFPRGVMTSWLRHHWDLNRLLGDENINEKDRGDHRHHAIDAVVIACIDRVFYNSLQRNAKELDKDNRTGLTMKDLLTSPPWKELREDVSAALEKTIIAHVPQRKIASGLHEETGIGFNKKKGVTVYRKTLDGDITSKQINSILDEVVKKQVLDHLDKFADDKKKAFSENVFHKDGRTKIKRVRVAQSKTSLKKLGEDKFGIRNQQGDIFRWMSYGNVHHVEILRDKKTKKIRSKFVTMMEAAHRARGIRGEKRPIIKTSHGDNFEFVMALHINDLVRITDPDGNSKRRYCRVQKLDCAGRLMLRLHTESKIDNKERELYKSVSTLVNEYGMEKVEVNAIGKLKHDKAHG